MQNKITEHLITEKDTHRHLKKFTLFMEKNLTNKFLFCVLSGLKIKKEVIKLLKDTYIIPRNTNNNVILIVYRILFGPFWFLLDFGSFWFFWVLLGTVYINRGRPIDPTVNTPTVNTPTVIAPTVITPTVNITTGNPTCCVIARNSSAANRDG